MLPATSEFFHKRSRNSDGCQSRCKRCNNASGKQWYADNQERHLELGRKWATANPERRKKIKRKYYEAHSESIREYSREYYKANAEQCRDASLRWYRANLEWAKKNHREWCSVNLEKTRVYKHRRRAAEGSFTKEEVDTLLESQWYECAYCGADLLERSYHLDHIVPVSKGGTSYIENIAAACPSCNLSKGAKDLDEWLSERKVPMCLT